MTRRGFLATATSVLACIAGIRIRLPVSNLDTTIDGETKLWGIQEATFRCWAHHRGAS